jgi:hypothetical protein
VIFDWYGNVAGVDYKPVHDATMAMIPLIKKRGMQYAICYEDQSIKHLIDFGVIAKADGQKTAKDTFAWMEQNWFNDGSYVKVDNRPLVLCFGPQHFSQKSEWDEIWSGLKARPYFIDLDARTDFADGAKPWSPMHLSSGGRLAIPVLIRYLNEFYRKQEQKPFVVGTAIVAFHDIYAQAGRPQGSYGFLDWSDGETYKLTWTIAEKARANVIQIQTWNDYAEGTNIEPTIERGYTDLEFTQEKRKERNDAFPFGNGDLRIPIELFKLMINGSTTDAQKQQIAGIYDLLFAGNAEGFREAVNNANIKYDLSVKPYLQTPSSGAKAVAAAFDPGGRTNLAFNKPTIASGKTDVYIASRAVDGNAGGSSYWEGAPNTWPATIHVDLVKAEPIRTVVVKLNPGLMWSKRVQRIEVKVSNDGTSWNNAVAEREYTFDPETNGNMAVIELNATARYVQLSFTANSGANSAQVAEFEVYGE